MPADTNFGIASPKVRLLPVLPSVVRENFKYNFDISASQWKTLQNSQFMPPFLVDQIENPEGTFAACFPSRRKYFVGNLLKSSVSTSDSDSDSGLSPDGKILWTPVSPTGPAIPGVITDIIKHLPSYYDGVPTSDPESRIPQETSVSGSSKSLGTYTGPLWSDKTYKEQSQPNDNPIILNFIKRIGTIPTEDFSGPTDEDIEDAIGTGTGRSDEPEGTDSTIYSNYCISQSRVFDGLWWGVESNDFLDENMPFWVTLEVPQKPPANSKNETLWVVSLGIDSGDNKDRYDLVLSLNKKPILFDYYGSDPGSDSESGSSEASGTATVRVFEDESSRLVTTEGRIDIGVMTSGGRLIFYVNGNTLIYSRTVRTGSKDDIGKLKEAKISKGKIRVYGTNTTASIYAYPMTFASFSAMAFPIPGKKTVDIPGDGKRVVDIEYSAPDEEGSPTGNTVNVLPSGSGDVEKAKIFGVDAFKFVDKNGTFFARPAFGLHEEGIVNFINSETLSVPAPKDVAGLSNINFFFLFMEPEDREWLGTTIPNAKTPYFFRLKGVDEVARDNKIKDIIDATDDVISVNESSSAPDYFHIKSSASITLYNEKGKYDFLRDRQWGIDISWSWNEIGTISTFTGIITSTSVNETPGKELMSLQCEDYTYILKNVPVINSPFYDGYIAHFVVKDLAERAGIKDIKKDWKPDIKEFFLPEGSSMSKPKAKYKGTDKIFDCMVNVIKRFEAYFYFDAIGTMHIDKLPGGLLGIVKGKKDIAHEFTSNPHDLKKTPILDQRNIDVTFESTVNKIIFTTLDRENRSWINMSTEARGDDLLLFKKIYMQDQPAYGGRDEAKAHMEKLKLRMFKPIRKISFKTVGNDSIALPLQFVTVDDVYFRLISISRSYKAEDNDFSQVYEAEWLNG